MNILKNYISDGDNDVYTNHQIRMNVISMRNGSYRR
jgi:hypothetical protein